MEVLLVSILGMPSDKNKNIYFSLLNELYHLDLITFDDYIGMRMINYKPHRDSFGPYPKFIELIDTIGFSTVLYTEDAYETKSIIREYYGFHKIKYLPQYKLIDLFNALSLIIPAFDDLNIHQNQIEVDTEDWKPFYYGTPKAGLLAHLFGAQDWSFGKKMLCYSDSDDVEDAVLEKHYNISETWKRPKSICRWLKITFEWYEKYYALFDQKLLSKIEKEIQKKNSEIEKGQNIEKEKALQSIIEAGDKGEQEVNFNLEWLDKKYTLIKSKSEKGLGVKVLNPSFKDEAQEIDHIVVGPQGVFLIETKNISGTVQITSSGNWLRKKTGETAFSAMQNPTAQINRHEKVIKSIIQDYDPEIKIISIICLANSGVMIEGEGNCTIPIVRADLITSFIESYKLDCCLDQATIDKVAEIIDSYIIV